MKSCCFLTGFACCVGVVFLRPSSCIGDGASEGGLKDAFTWFDSLQFPDITNKPFVEVIRQRRSDDSRVHGFLLNADDTSFTVFTLRLHTRTFSSLLRNDGTRYHYEHRDLATMAGNCLREVEKADRAFEAATRKSEEEQQAGRPGRMVRRREAVPGMLGTDFNDRGSLFVLAWGCRGNNLSQLSDRLAGRSSQLPCVQIVYGGPEFVKCLQDEIGSILILTVIDQFRDPEISRTSILNHCRWLCVKFPDNRLLEDEGIARYRQLLATMVQEDAGHKFPDTRFESLPTAQQVAELVFQLRDHNGQPASSPPANDDLFTDPRGRNAPADQLLDIGMPAVPHLIDSINDPRPTRSAIEHRGDTRLLTVGDCVAMIIHQIGFEAVKESGLSDEKKRDLRSILFSVCRRPDKDQTATSEDRKKAWAKFEAQLMNATNR